MRHRVAASRDTCDGGNLIGVMLGDSGRRERWGNTAATTSANDELEATVRNKPAVPVRSIVLALRATLAIPDRRTSSFVGPEPPSSSTTLFCSMKTQPTPRLRHRESTGTRWRSRGTNETRRPSRAERRSVLLAARGRTGAALGLAKAIDASRSQVRGESAVAASGSVAARRASRKEYERRGATYIYERDPAAGGPLCRASRIDAS